MQIIYLHSGPLTPCSLVGDYRLTYWMVS